MFESAALPHEIDKAAYDVEEPKLREDLLDAQFDLVEARSFPVIVLLAGLDGAGKGEAINRLYGWLDVHYLETNAFAERTDEERARPRLWRYWQALPPKGKIGVFFNSWYQEPTTAFVLGRIGEAEFERELQAISRLELMLAREGALILKFWFHLSAGEQRKRLRKAKYPTSGSSSSKRSR